MSLIFNFALAKDIATTLADKSLICTTSVGPLSALKGVILSKANVRTQKELTAGYRARQRSRSRRTLQCTRSQRHYLPYTGVSDSTEKAFAFTIAPRTATSFTFSGSPCRSARESQQRRRRAVIWGSQSGPDAISHRSRGAQRISALLFNKYRLSFFRCEFQREALHTDDANQQQKSCSRLSIFSLSFLAFLLHAER